MPRKLCLAGLGVAVAALLLGSQATIDGQGKTDLNKQIAQLKATLAERDKSIAKLHNDFNAYKKSHPGAAKLQKDLDTAHQTIKDRDATIASLQDKSPTTVADLTKENSALRKQVRELQAAKKAPFVHTVILKLKQKDDDQVKKVQDEADKTLAKIDGVRSIYIGKPAEKGTPELAQKGYQLGVVVLLDDADALQKFLDDSLHRQFMDKMGDSWERPVVYDFQRDMDDAKKDEKNKDAK